MNKVHIDISIQLPATISYQGQELHFFPVSEDDHIGQYLKRSHSFYEADVLEKIRERTRGRQGTAIDAGAFIGTHSIFFQKFCECNFVFSFEANPDTFPFLVKNIHANNLDEKIVPIPKALGSSPCFAHISFSREGNQGNTVLKFDKNIKTGIEVTTLDVELKSSGKMLPIKLIKIDVEGAEIQVLQGARNTIHTHRPLLCIEIHKTSLLLRVLMDIRGNGYLILDCLGSSPNYIFETTDSNALRRYVSNIIWIARSLIPPHLYNNTRWYLKRLAQIAAGNQ
jgi:FkbM family methyltransferase